MPFSRWLAIALVIASWTPGVSAQDVEMLGRRHGTRPPEGYYRELARNPGAFRFTRGRAGRRALPEALRTSGGAGVGAGAAAVGLGPRSEPVVGHILIPVVLGLFDDSPASPPQTPAAIQGSYFGTQPGAATVSSYYAEVSSDSISLDGDVSDWVRSSRTEAETTQSQSGLVCCGIGDWIEDLLALQTGVDWGRYDNDGPDGVPNSGDDDGFVDALAVMHPSRGAECDGATTRIWSHKWTLSDARSARAPYVTSSPRFGGGWIVIDDYFVQGVLACSGGGLNPIGVFTHETGHAFGLPDLYDTRLTHAGAGVWELMASGTYGCNGSTPSRPCHLGAWSKAMLGWVDVVTLAPDTDFGTLTLPPVETTGSVYRVDAGDGSGEYFLLENRQDVPSRVFDKSLRGEGLLVWQIDEDVLLARWAANTVNSNSHMGVWLRQADGRNDLGRSGGGSGDAGDPFPGSTGNTQFHAGSTPSSISFQGTATGLTILDVGPTGGEDVSFRLLTRFTDVTVQTAGAQGGSGLLSVDGAPVGDPHVFPSAPFESRVIEAAAGEPLGVGIRRPFVQWEDAPAAPRSRALSTPLANTTYVASYAGTQYELAIALNGGVNGVAPGIFTTAPAASDLWFVPDQQVEVTAVAQTGFSFSGWTGALEGQPNPASVTMSAPVQAGADFVLTYAVADVQVPLTATVPESVQLTVENGTAPIAWAVVGGAMPEGVALSLDGLLSGTPLDLGTFPISVQATDAIGLTATASLALHVGAPSIPLAQLSSAFLLVGPQLDSVQAAFLDRQGNRDGAYDLGDFRAWVLANPSLPLSAGLAPRASEGRPRRVAIPVRLAGPSGERR